MVFWAAFPSSFSLEVSLTERVVITEGLQQKKDRYTGRIHKPWRRPSTTMPKNIRKNMRKISEAAKASTTMPRKVVNPSSDKKENLGGVHDIYSTG